MLKYSRRRKIQEKKIIKKIIFSIGFAIITAVISLYFGLPLLAQLIVGISSFDNPQENIQLENTSYIFPPVLNPIPEATNSSKIKVSGYASKESNISIILNGVTMKKIQTDDDGLFEEFITLNKGENSIKARAFIDDETSDLSEVLTITYITKTPKLDIFAPEEMEEYREPDETITIKGNTDLGNKVIINDRTVIVDPDGNFEYKVKLSEGENEFAITAQDVAGNEKTVKRKVIYKK